MKNLLDYKIWYAVYDGEEADENQNDENQNDENQNDETETEESKVNSQAELNSVLKREKEKFRKERQQYIAQLEEIKKKTKMSEEEKSSLEQKIEELKTSNLTVEEKAKRKEQQLKKEYDQRLQQAVEGAQHWENNFRSLKITNEIKEAAITNGVIPSNIKFVEALIGPKTKLNEDVDEEGKNLGSYTAKVRFNDRDKDGNQIETSLTISEAVKRMKELPDEYGSLFGSPSGGLGTNNGTPNGKKIDLSKLTPEEYYKLRKSNPNAIYG